MNKVFLIGRLGEDTSTKGNVTSFSFATSRVKRRDGETVRDETTGYAEQDTEWHRITCFKSTGEFAAKHLKKGDAVAITGRIHYSTYEKDGVKHNSSEIIVEDFEFLPK
jgi:single-strand DNA-binding protein